MRSKPRGREKREEGRPPNLLHQLPLGPSGDHRVHPFLEHERQTGMSAYRMNEIAATQLNLPASEQDALVQVSRRSRARCRRESARQNIRCREYASWRPCSAPHAHHKMTLQTHDASSGRLTKCSVFNGTTSCRITRWAPTRSHRRTSLTSPLAPGSTSRRT